MERGQAYITGIGAFVTLVLALGNLHLGFIGGALFVVGIVGVLVGYLFLTEDANGKSRFLGAGALSLAVALLPRGSEAAALDVVDNTRAYVLSEGGKVLGVAGIATIVGAGLYCMFTHSTRGLKVAGYGLLGLVLGGLAVSGQAEAIANRLVG